MKKFFTLLSIGLYTQLAFSQSHNINLIYSWTDTTIIPVSSFGNQRFNDVWGYEQNGLEYAIIGSTMGVHFFNITDTTNLVYVDFVAGRVQGSGVVHREFHSYQNYLYVVCDEGASSLQIIDMQYLPDSVHLVYDNDSLIVRSHELHVDTAMKKLYLFGPKTDLFSPGVPVGYPAMILDISNPVDPQYLAVFTHNTITYVHDGYVYNDTAFFNAAYEGLYYGYMGDPVNPVELDVMPFYLDQGFNHSGWLTPDKTHYVMLDETQGMRMKMIDMQPGLNFFTVCGLFEAGIGPYNVAHNPHIKGNYLYVSYYQDGVRIFDISNPCFPYEVAWYDTWPGDALAGEYRGAWGVYGFLSSGKVLVSDMQTGLYVLRPQPAYFGIENESIFSFKVYPNPTAGIIQLSETFEIVKLIDVSGKLVKILYNTPTISVNELSNGLYTIGVKKEGKWGYKKLIKE